MRVAQTANGRERFSKSKALPPGTFFDARLFLLHKRHSCHLTGDDPRMKMSYISNNTFGPNPIQEHER